MRAEFSKATKRAALERSGGRCEASGKWYGFEPGVRCNSLLANGLQFDHAIADAIGGKPTLENCVCACKLCHAFKTVTRDITLAAKTQRIQDKHRGIKKASSFPKRVDPWGKRFRNA